MNVLMYASRVDNELVRLINKVRSSFTPYWKRRIDDIIYNHYKKNDKKPEEVAKIIATEWKAENHYA